MEKRRLPRPLPSSYKPQGEITHGLDFNNTQTKEKPNCENARNQKIKFHDNSSSHSKCVERF